MTPPLSKLSLKFLSSSASPGRGKLLIPSRQRFFKNLFPPTVERGGEKYDLLYQNSVRKYEGNLEP